MFKRFVCVFLTLLLFSASCALADECEHIYRMDQTRYDYGYFMIDANTHQWRDYYYGVCTECSNRALMYLPGDPAFHNLLLDDDAHYVNQVVHYYFYECAQCEFSYTIEKLCSGEDCNKLVQIQRNHKPRLQIK